MPSGLLLERATRGARSGHQSCSAAFLCRRRLLFQGDMRETAQAGRTAMPRRRHFGIQARGSFSRYSGRAYRLGLGRGCSRSFRRHVIGAMSFRAGDCFMRDAVDRIARGRQEADAPPAAMSARAMLSSQRPMQMQVSIIALKSQFHVYTPFTTKIDCRFAAMIKARLRLAAGKCRHFRHCRTWLWLRLRFSRPLSSLKHTMRISAAS